MRVSKKWLEKFFDQPLPNAEALSDALTFHAFEIDGIEKVSGGDASGEADYVLDVKVTPNRGHDCLSHRGIAKELSAILKLQFAHDPFLATQKPSFKKVLGSPEAPLGEGASGQTFSQEVSVSPTSATVAGSISVDIKTKLCKRYIAAHIKGVKVGPSPKWLQERLEAIGQRSINNVVDATNFVMFNTGQPLHAFDASKLSQKDGAYAIEVRTACAGEKMFALDGKEYLLNESMLVIADANTRAPSAFAEGALVSRVIGIAGVKGGMPSGISEATTDIIVESANFDGVTTRKTASALKLRTDASSRFEQVISPELCAHGIAGMMEFVQNVCGGELVSLVDVYPEPQQQTYVSVTVNQVNKILGTTLTSADIADVLTRLSLAYKEQDGVFEVQPPFERLDLTISEDLVEEVGRIIGYDKVPTVELSAFSKQPEINEGFYAAEKAREDLMSQGYSEVFTSVFAETGERTVLNKVDGVNPYLRSEILNGLSKAMLKNVVNKDLLGLKKVKLFEIGSVWKEGKEEIHIATLEEKNTTKLDGGMPKSLHSNWSGEEKKLEPISAASYENYPISTAVQYKPFSRYPYIVRDVAFWTPENTSEEEVKNLIKQEAGDPPAGGVLQSVRLFDRFQKGEKLSLGFRLIFQSFDKTLEDSEANTAMEKVYAALKAKGFEIR